MRVTLRSLLIGLPIAVAAVPIAYVTFLYGFGRAVVSQPEPSTTPVPQLFAHALWAAAGGGREPELRPLNPIGLFRYVRCTESSQRLENGQSRNERDFDCQRHLPAMRLREHLANQHVGDNNIQRNSFRGGAAAFSTMLGFSGTWTKDEFLRTAAERAQFGNGWRGAAMAARGLFDRSLEDLTAPQAALIAARAGAAGSDPWCEPDLAARARNRVLSGMLANGAISEAQYEEGSSSALGLKARPADQRPCGR
ncbi:MAG TPA: transglycosylase domain-containing protein [Vicinamibacterales bacterium]|nr:transglycosylase domain-containing protein [Vicinamibacterales bacterium]